MSTSRHLDDHELHVKTLLEWYKNRDEKRNAIKELLEYTSRPGVVDKILRDNSHLLIDIEKPVYPVGMFGGETWYSRIPYHYNPDAKDTWLGLTRSTVPELRASMPTRSPGFEWDRTKVEMHPAQLGFYEQDLAPGGLEYTYIDSLTVPEDEREEEESMYDFSVRKATNGWIVSVGCFTLAFNNPTELGIEIARYLVNPDAVYKEYQKKFSPQENFENQADAVPRNYDRAGIREATPEELSRRRDLAGEAGFLRGGGRPANPVSTGIDDIKVPRGY
jgi:hypothetical protein